jgi:hypothetical protein
VDLGAIVASECRFSYRKDFGTLLRPRSAEFLLNMGIAVVPSAENLALQIVSPLTRIKAYVHSRGHGLQWVGLISTILLRRTSDHPTPLRRHGNANAWNSPLS